MNKSFYSILKETSVSSCSKFCFLFCIVLLTCISLSAQQCSPISSLTCPSVVRTLPFALTFTGAEGGLNDKNGKGTGFTMADRPSTPLAAPTNASIPGYEASKLQVNSNTLSITTTAGINYLNPAQSAGTNSQVNALGVGFLAPDRFYVQTSLVKPNMGSGKSEQAGIWFGLDEDNFIKLVIISSGSGTVKLEMRKEVGAMSGSSDSKASASMDLSNSTVKLKLVMDKTARTVEGFYGVDGGTDIGLGSLPIPVSFIDGKTMPDGATKNITFAGIFGTNRNSSTPLVYTFDHFQIEPIISTSYFNKIEWAIGTNLPYNVNEAQGRVVNDKLYSFGGFDSKKPCCTPTKRAFVYDPVAQTWAPIADLPYTPNGTNFGGITHAGIATDGVDIFLAGGYTSNSTGTGQIFGTNQVWKYVVSQDTYVQLPNLPVNISAGQLEYLDKKLHYIGGTNSSRTSDLGTHYVLDLNNLQAGWSALAPLQNPRHHAGSAVYGGKIYMVGGQHAHDAALITQKDLDVYDPTTNSWHRLADLPVAAGATGRSHISSAVFVKSDRILVLAGEIKNGTSTNMVSAYTPGSDSWEDLTPLPLDRYSGIGTTLKGNLYYFGGSNSKTTYEGTPVYDLNQSCSPISSLSCAAIVKALPLSLNFNGSEGGMKDKNGIATGFTVVDNPTNPLLPPTDPGIPGYEASKLEVGNGNLLISTTSGINYLNPSQSFGTNSQVNTLGAGFVAPPSFNIETTLLQPNAGTGNSEQAGLWFGLNEDNFVKFVVISAGNGTSKFELRKEVGAMSGSSDVKTSPSMVLSSSTVKLRLEVNANAGTIEGFYSINGAIEKSMGALNIPQSFTTGKTLSDGATNNVTFAGIFATNRSSSSSLIYTFDNFKIEAGATPANQCAPISTLCCPAVLHNLPVTLNFTGGEGGITDKTGAGTGFTMVDRPGAPLITPENPDIPGYEPSRLTAGNNRLSINTTPGISYLNPSQSAGTNSQVNALGVGFVPPNHFQMETKILQPEPGNGRSEQAGLWFGLDEDNFVKFVVISAGNGTSAFEMRKEVGALSGNLDVTRSGSMTLSSSNVTIKLEVDKSASTIEGFYSINGSANISIGRLNIPKSFTAGKTLSDGVTGNVSFAGVFATNRSAPGALTYTFEHFKIEEVLSNTTLSGQTLTTGRYPEKLLPNELEGETGGLELFPNPVNQQYFKVKLPAGMKGSYRLELIDTEGKSYKLPDGSTVPGENVIEVDISGLRLKSGVYLIRMYAANRQAVKSLKFVLF